MQRRFSRRYYPTRLLRSGTSDQPRLFCFRTRRRGLPRNTWSPWSVSCFPGGGTRLDGQVGRVVHRGPDNVASTCSRSPRFSLYKGGPLLTEANSFPAHFYTMRFLVRLHVWSSRFGWGSGVLTTCSAEHVFRFFGIDALEAFSALSATRE